MLSFRALVVACAACLAVSLVEAQMEYGDFFNAPPFAPNQFFDHIPYFSPPPASGNRRIAPWHLQARSFDDNGIDDPLVYRPRKPERPNLHFQDSTNLFDAEFFNSDRPKQLWSFHWHPPVSQKAPLKRTTTTTTTTTTQKPYYFGLEPLSSKIINSEFVQEKIKTPVRKQQLKKISYKEAPFEINDNLLEGRSNIVSNLRGRDGLSAENSNNDVQASELSEIDSLDHSDPESLQTDDIMPRAETSVHNQNRYSIKPETVFNTKNSDDSENYNEEDKDIRSYSQLQQLPKPPPDDFRDSPLSIPTTGSAFDELNTIANFAASSKNENDDDSQDDADDAIKTYGFLSKGYGYAKNNKKHDRASKVYGFDNKGYGIFKLPPSTHASGSKKSYRYESLGTGSAKVRGYKTKRTYLYSSKGDGTSETTNARGKISRWGDSNNNITGSVDAKSRYGYESKGYGTHASDGKKEAKSYGYSKSGYGYQITPIERNVSNCRNCQSFAHKPVSNVAQIIKLRSPAYRRRQHRPDLQPPVTYYS